MPTSGFSEQLLVLPLNLVPLDQGGGDDHLPPHLNPADLLDADPVVQLPPSHKLRLVHYTGSGDKTLHTLPTRHLSVTRHLLEVVPGNTLLPALTSSFRISRHCSAYADLVITLLS